MPGSDMRRRHSARVPPERRLSAALRGVRGFRKSAPRTSGCERHRVSRESRIPRIGETREYVRRVLRYYKDYRQQDLHTLASSETRPRIDGLSYVSSN